VRRRREEKKKGEENTERPIVDDIPVMLIDEGDKWISVEESELPVPPPAN